MRHVVCLYGWHGGASSQADIRGRGGRSTTESRERRYSTTRPFTTTNFVRFRNGSNNTTTRVVQYNSNPLTPLQRHRDNDTRRRRPTTSVIPTRFTFRGSKCPEHRHGRRCQPAQYEHRRHGNGWWAFNAGGHGDATARGGAGALVGREAWVALCA